MRRFPKGGRQTPTYFSYFTLPPLSLPGERETGGEERSRG